VTLFVTDPWSSDDPWQASQPVLNHPVAPTSSGSVDTADICARISAIEDIIGDLVAPAFRVFLRLRRILSPPCVVMKKPLEIVFLR